MVEVRTGVNREPHANAHALACGSAIPIIWPKFENSQRSRPFWRSLRDWSAWGSWRASFGLGAASPVAGRLRRDPSVTPGRCCRAADARPCWCSSASRTRRARGVDASWRRGSARRRSSSTGARNSARLQGHEEVLEASSHRTRGDTSGLHELRWPVLCEAVDRLKNRWGQARKVR